MPSITKEATLDIDIFCGRCGAGLCGDTDVKRRGGEECFFVDPCPSCMERAIEDAIEEEREKQ